jgi:hypothetical protein
MLTGAFRPSGARNAGQEAIADASDDPGGEDRPLLGQREERSRHHVLGMLEDGAGVQERLEVEDVVVCRGRRPHVFLHSKTGGGSPKCRAAARSLLKPPWLQACAGCPVLHR